MKIKKFEYLLQSNQTPLEMKALGELGWELVSVFEGKDSVYYYQFKRRIQ